jgi:hypothetical protein
VIGQILLGLVGVFLLFRHQRRHLHRRHLRHAELEAAAEAARRSAARASSRRADRHRLRAQLGELKAVFARGLCFFVPGIAIGTLLPVIGRFELKLDEFAFGILYAVFGVGAVAGAM